MKALCMGAGALAALLLPFLPLWECRTCGAAALAPKGLQVSCPACRDGGRTSAFSRLRRPSTDPSIRLLLRNSSGTLSAEDESEAALGELVRRAGETLENRGESFHVAGRFVRDGEEDVVLALRSQIAVLIPGSARADAWLFSVRGELLDSLSASSSTRQGMAVMNLADGPTLEVHAGSGFVTAEFARFRLRQRGRPPQLVAPSGGPWTPEQLANGVRRYRISAGRFVSAP